MQSERHANRTFHVVPVDDLREHSTDKDVPCWCDPKIDHYTGAASVHVHNSLDEREKYETGERKPH
jgi:hypothetical protein